MEGVVVCVHLRLEECLLSAQADPDAAELVTALLECSMGGKGGF